MQPHEPSALSITARSCMQHCTVISRELSVLLEKEAGDEELTLIQHLLGKTAI